MKNKNIKAHLALLGANIIYGANFLIAKGLMPNYFKPSALVLLRVIAAGLLFWIVKQFVKEKIEKKDFKLLAFCGLFGISTNMLLFFHGLSLTSPIDASIIMTTTPVIVLILSAFLLKERITTNKYLGIILGGIGAVFLILYGKTSEGTSSFLGNLFVFLNACSYGLYLVLVKPLMKKYKAITVISWVFLFGLIFIIPFGISDLATIDFSTFTTNTYLALTFVIIGTTFLTYLFNIYALSHVPPSVNGSYIYLQPVLSFIIVSIYAFAFGHEEYSQDINLIKILSCFMVILGVFMISKKPKIKLT
ncbi:DMT family transporter [Lutibacter flavus]|uniref:Permease of the drug/metabolite transporter (DMT) superfamily n=1 Tax=Lutibacter flavus TaxID=691689 RepID=A0A238X869_9FLAO|nr:DMT family transporter [Lutibacter flavus]SNR55226.1 Permease of the drug/metabolite transporter (DMT) superfamily [Lutibacter flavus]